MFLLWTQVSRVLISKDCLACSHSQVRCVYTDLDPHEDRPRQNQIRMCNRVVAASSQRENLSVASTTRWYMSIQRARHCMPLPVTQSQHYIRIEISTYRAHVLQECCGH